MNKQLVRIMLALATTLTATHVVAQDIGTVDPQQLNSVMPKRPYSPYAGRNFSTRVYWGDTHLHTGFSMDAGAFGARLTPVDAYRFAKGEEITASSGQPVKLSRPLDFLVVTDHSDGMGFFPIVMSAATPEVLADPQGKRWYDMIQSGDGRDGRRSKSSAPSASSHDAEVDLPRAGHEALSTMRGSRRSRRPRKPTTRVDSRRSSATSGPRTPAATTCIAT